MSKIIPFPALIPKAELGSRTICPPYDVITSEEAREIVDGNPYSLLHVTKAEVDLPHDVPEYDDRVYEKARANFMKFQKDGWLIRDTASLYIYRMDRQGHIQTGLVCGTSVDEYDLGLIKQHEKTRKPKEDDRTRFAYAIRAHAEPVFLTFRATDEMKKLLLSETTETPLYDTVPLCGVRHTLWRAKSVQKFVDAAKEIEAIYVADGHHRSASASRVRAKMRAENPAHRGDEAYNFFPAVLIPSDEVRIYRYDWDGDPDKRPLADVTIDDVMALSDRGGIMPPKSTWFAPKLASGLFVYAF